MDTISLLTYIALLATCVQVLYWIILFGKLAFHRYPPRSGSEQAGVPAVSVIICARNEAQNLKNNLPHILNQRYRLFEVIVVNDSSTDETGFRLLEFKKKYTNLTVLNTPFATPPGKKTALRLGIEQAKYDLLLLTDADCIPKSPYWIQEMQTGMSSEKEIVLGFSPYQYQKGFLNVCIRFEAVYTAVQYFSFALFGLPYMGVGRNLMYRKELFLRSDRFQKHLDVASGDDDLFINAVANKSNTSVVLSTNSFVYTRPKTTWAGYYYQKTRHFSTGVYYRMYHQILLGGLAASHFVHYVAVCTLLFFPDECLFAITLFLVRLFVVASLYYPILKHLRSQPLWFWVPAMDFLLPFYYLFFAPAIFFGSRATWRQE